MTALTERAMLAKLHIRTWHPHKLDRDISRKVADELGIDPKIGRYHKTLLKSDSLQAVWHHCRKVTDYHFRRTLPWFDDGTRVLPAKMFLDYSEEMRKNIAKFERLRDRFVEEYQNDVERAREQLRSAFKDTDYPSPEIVQAKFGMSLRFFPLPDARDWRVDVGEEYEKQIREGITEQMREVEKQAMEDVWNRVYEMVERLHDRLGNAKHLRTALFSQAEELVDLLPKLNITDDPELNKMGQDIRLKLLSTNIDTLRGDEDVRKDKAKAAKKILDSMSAYASQE